MIKKIKELYIKNEEIINYLIVGGLTTLISLATYYLCVFTFLNPNVAWQLQLANIISWIFAVTFAYITNRIFVFKSENNKKLKEAINFYLSRISTGFLDMGLMYIFVTIFGFNDKIIKLLVQIILIITNYILSKFLVFKKNKI
jgi:putative flippase GtrA